MDPASFLIRWGCARLHSVLPGHGLHGPRAPQLRALWLWSSTATGLCPHAGAKRSAGVLHPLPKMTGMKMSSQPWMGGARQSFLFREEAQAIFLRQCPRVTPGRFSADLGSAALPRLLSAPSWPFFLPRAPILSLRYSAPRGCAVPHWGSCTLVHQHMGEAEHAQKLGLPPAWLLNPSGASAFPKPVAARRPYSSSRGLPPTLVVLP